MRAVYIVVLVLYRLELHHVLRRVLVAVVSDVSAILTDVPFLVVVVKFLDIEAAASLMVAK